LGSSKKAVAALEKAVAALGIEQEGCRGSSSKKAVAALAPPRLLKELGLIVKVEHATGIVGDAFTRIKPPSPPPPPHA